MSRTTPPPEPHHDPNAIDQAEAEQEARSLYAMKRFWASLAAALLVVLLAMVTYGGPVSFAQAVMSRFTIPEPEVEEEEQPLAAAAGARIEEDLTPASFSHHPDVLYQPYLAGSVLEAEGPDSPLSLVNEFRELLELYYQRMGVDDNFTIRVVDNRTDEVLELFVLEEEREAYEETGEVNWGAIDRLRRQETRRLVHKYAARGVPRPAITVKWGRSAQTRQARRRDDPFIEYEVRLARYLGLSLLATEVGTVETFNQDDLVSSVGARSRYQMMPYILRQADIHHYDLQTGTGRRVEVREEHHPLLTMEPAFKLMKGYTGAVGHEIPGISAYHTGPGNIYKVYRTFLTRGDERVRERPSVMDAYMWATTEGFPTMRANTSFGPYSRGYVASVYGALKATEHIPIDTSQTMRAERVRLQRGEAAQLSQLLRALEEQGYEGADGRSLYNQFRHLNAHFDLPVAPDSVGTPTSGDVRLVARQSGHPVRFFLPLGATQALQRADVDVLDASQTFRFDEDTYNDAEPLAADRAYEELIAEISQFGFNRNNQRRLEALYDTFQRLADQYPDSHYRQARAEAIATHRQIWQTRAWRTLRSTTEAALGQLEVEPEPPVPNPTPRLPSPLDMAQE